MFAKYVREMHSFTNPNCRIFDFYIEFELSSLKRIGRIGIGKTMQFLNDMPALMIGSINSVKDFADSILWSGNSHSVICSPSHIFPLESEVCRIGHVSVPFHIVHNCGLYTSVGFFA